MSDLLVTSFWTKYKKVASDFHTPILLSIATLREYTSSKIIIIDYSNSDWEHYPHMMNFDVIKCSPYFGQIEGLSDFASKSLSRAHDMWFKSLEHEENHVICFDADMLWLREPGRFDDSKFHCRHRNNGCYSYHKNSVASLQFMMLLQAYTALAVSNPKKREEFKSATGLNYFNDETVCVYTMQTHPELISEVPFENNGPLMDMLKTCTVDDHKLVSQRNIHLLKTIPEIVEVRGSLGYVIEEVAVALRKQLSGDKLDVQCDTIGLVDLLNLGEPELIRRVKDIQIIKHIKV